MDDQDSLAAAIHEGVVLHAYDPAWPARFTQERERLLGLGADVFIDVQHIGSTAVPGMPAKPIIDLLAGVASMAVARGLAERVAGWGYTGSAEFNATLADRQWFMRHANGHRTHHLHVVVHGEAAWQDRLRFRDVLRADAGIAARYVELKQQLAQAQAADREAYTQGKEGFVRKVLEGA